MEEERMPKVNVSKDALRLTLSDIHHMKRVEEQNLRRVTKLKNSRSKSRMIGSFLALGAFSIYAWTIYSVKQEKFLDDFEEPEKISDPAPQ